MPRCPRKKITRKWQLTIRRLKFLFSTAFSFFAKNYLLRNVKENAYSCCSVFSSHMPGIVTNLDSMCILQMRELTSEILINKPI